MPQDADGLSTNPGQSVCIGTPEVSDVVFVGRETAESNTRHAVGRPYADEMDRLTKTYVWAVNAPLGNLPRAARGAATLPLITIGSGGSYTTAQFAAAIHRRYGSSVASVMTPLEAVSSPQSLRQSAILLATAGGKNPDVLGAFDRLLSREPRRFIVLCAREGSPLARRAEKHPYVEFADFEPPSGKDGFLATNSLLASVIQLTRAYAAAYAAADPLPKSLGELLGANPGEVAEVTDRLCRPLWERQTLVVLYGPNCHAAAVDLESKFSEAALGTVQLADFRNFAHGRHHWLAKRGGETAVLALVSEEDRGLADAMLALLPKGIPVARLNVSGSEIAAGLSALAQVFMVVGSAGKARGIDPGDPGVPAFGRKIYHFRAFAEGDYWPSPVPPAEAAAIERKSGASVSSLLARGTLENWQSAYRTFRGGLVRARFRGVVLDYDGTLCYEVNRFDPLSETVSRQLNRLLRAGAVLGVATGRGKSVKDSLRQCVQPRFWKRVVVGYYNGGDTAALSDDTRPDGRDAVGPPLEPVASVLRTAFGDPRLAKLTFRLPQITIEPTPGASGDDLWNLLQHLIYTIGVPGVSAVRSSHSMDVVAPGVNKRAVVDRVRELVSGGPDTQVLCVGDRGRWPGNDYSLLSGPHSLSVDEVSPDPVSCWNLAAPGRRGAAATVDYLQGLAVSGDGLKLNIE